MIDEKLENKNSIIELTNKYEINRIVIFVYHFQANEMIESRHKFMKNALSKMNESESISML